MTDFPVQPSYVGRQKSFLRSDCGLMTLANETTKLSPSTDSLSIKPPTVAVSIKIGKFNESIIDVLTSGRIGTVKLTPND